MVDRAKRLNTTTIAFLMSYADDATVYYRSLQAELTGLMELVGLHNTGADALPKLDKACARSGSGSASP